MVRQPKDEQKYEDTQHPRGMQVGGTQKQGERTSAEEPEQQKKLDLQWRPPSRSWDQGGVTPTT